MIDCLVLLCSADWGPNIDVVGFCFLDLAANYEPPKSLVEWLEKDKAPIYIGFGSLVSFYVTMFICLGHVIMLQ